MGKERQIINTNIRLNLLEEEDRKAWEYLQQMDRKQYKSYTRAVVAALNGYFGHMEKIKNDPYLETRAKEDEFLQKVMDAVDEGIDKKITEKTLSIFTNDHLPSIDEKIEEILQKVIAEQLSDILKEIATVVIKENSLQLLQTVLQGINESLSNSMSPEVNRKKLSD